MIVKKFTEYFLENETGFKELVARLTASGYVTDEGFGVSRCLFESVSHHKFESVFRRHFPGQPVEVQVTSTAFRRNLGEYVYVIYDELTFSGRVDIEHKLRSDGVFDIHPDDYAK
jgi:hypothetical protein